MTEGRSCTNKTFGRDMLLRRRCSCVKSVVLWISWRGHLKTFSLVNHTKLTSLSEYLASSIFDRLSLAWRLASFSSWPRCLLKHFRPRSWWMIRTMDACARPVSRAIWDDVWNDDTVAGPPGLRSTPPLPTHFILYAPSSVCRCHAFGRCFQFPSVSSAVYQARLSSSFS